jgi:hypothetical protein
MVAMLLAVASLPAWAQDPFEIQVYDSATAPPWDTGLELHANYFVRGTTAAGPGALLPTNHVFHLTFEPHLGLTDWAEVGGYLQTALQPDGTYDYAGVKLRCKARVPELLAGRIGLALNTELSAIPSAYSESYFGAELRPIADARAGRLYVSINPIVDIDFEGDLAGRAQFEPAAKVGVVLFEDRAAIGTEYYGAIGPIDAPFALSDQVHRIFAVVDLIHIPIGPIAFGLNAGVGYGIAAGEKWIIKSILEVARW